ncbi:MAG: hypothetical protein L6408_05910 [Nanoarchaeota archaeon]|nr:hypothetical protein [Nanoarchaeota archaeon]
MKYGIWYPDESVCRRKDISNTDWIQKQKKIARISKNKEGYFTVERLIKIERFSSKMKGENPDKENPLEG